MSGYRPEIDGLRAVAVIAVVLYHAGFSKISGGFLGVDVFFVISGYLITSILISDLQHQRFSIAQFYERRARRLLPALFTVALTCLPFAWFWLDADEFKRFGQSLAAVTLFASNFYFLRHSDYFAPDAESFTLLHTWSLAVEEQFYVVFPLLLWLIWTYRRTSLRAILAILSLLTFCLCDWASRHYSSANFYMLPTRAWELLAGSLVALQPLRQGIHRLSPLLKELLALFGLFCILIPIFVYDSQTPFPGRFAAVPVLGTALYIQFAQIKQWSGRLLSNRVMVGIGLISYSLYLWHQPVFAFSKVPLLGHQSPMSQIALIGLSLALAILSWRYVERPLRYVRCSRKTVFTASGLSSFILIAVGVSVHAAHGFPSRIPENILGAMSDAKRKFSCAVVANKATNQLSYQRCRLGIKPGEPRIAFIGDSHALAMAPAIDNILTQAKLSGRLYSLFACPPIPDTQVIFAGTRHKCQEFNHQVFTNIGQNQQINTVVLIARWNLFLDGWFDNGLGGRESGKMLRLEGYDKNTLHELADHFSAGLRKYLPTQRIVLVEQGPEFGWNVPRYAFHNYLANGQLSGPELPIHLLQQRWNHQHRLLTLVSAQTGAELVELMPVFCSEQSCSSGKGILYFRDDDHLSYSGANQAALKSRLADLLLQ